MSDEAGVENSSVFSEIDRGAPSGISPAQRETLRQQVETVPPIKREFIQERLTTWLEKKVKTPNPKPLDELVKEAEKGIREIEKDFPSAADLIALEFIEKTFLMKNFNPFIWEPVIVDLMVVEKQAKGTPVGRMEHKEDLDKYGKAGPGDEFSRKTQEGFVGARVGGEYYKKETDEERAERIVQSLGIVSESRPSHESKDSTEAKGLRGRLETLERDLRFLNLGGPLLPKGTIHSVYSGERTDRGIDINVLFTGGDLEREDLEAKKLSVGKAMVEMTVVNGEWRETFRIWGDPEVLKRFCPEPALESRRMELNLAEEKRLIEAFANDTSGKFGYDPARLPDVLSFSGRVLGAVEKERNPARVLSTEPRLRVPVGQAA